MPDSFPNNTDVKTVYHPVGKTVSVPEGSTIWAAQGQGNIIPYLCHKLEPGYRSDGNCRACTEVEGERR